MNYLLLPCSVNVEEGAIPDDLKDTVQTKRHELIETVANVDNELGEMFLSDQTPSPDELMVIHYSYQIIILYMYIDIQDNTLLILIYTLYVHMYTTILGYMYSLILIIYFNKV